MASFVVFWLTKKKNKKGMDRNICTQNQLSYCMEMKKKRKKKKKKKRKGRMSDKLKELCLFSKPFSSVYSLWSIQINPAASKGGFKTFITYLYQLLLTITIAFYRFSPSFVAFVFKFGMVK